MQLCRPSRVSRARLRMSSLVEHGGSVAYNLLVVLPILVDLAWVIVYFAERQSDVFYDKGPCDANSSSASPSPFFVTHRTTDLWLVQVVFAALMSAFWMPLRVVRPDAHRGALNFVGLTFVDLVTLLPFMLSLVFYPATNAFVPSFLRVWVARNAFDTLFTGPQLRARVCRLFMVMLAVAVTMIAVFEYTENNWPVVPVAGAPLYSPYACVTFLESLYWFVVTFSTVGYGDVVPVNDIARIAVIVCILIFLLLLPLFVNTVFAITALASDYALVSHRVDGDFCIVAGHVRGHTCTQALLSVQPYRRTDKYSHLVFISTHAVSESLKQARREADTYCRPVFLQGTVASPADAARARLRLADALMLLPDLASDASSDGHFEPAAGGGEGADAPLGELRADIDRVREASLQRDWGVVGKAWAAHALRRDGKDAVGGGRALPLRLVLFHHSNLDLVLPAQDRHAGEVESADTSCRTCSGDVALCLDKMEQLVAASSVLLPGFSTLLTHLLLTGLHSSAARSAVLFEQDQNVARQMGRDLMENELFIYTLPADALATTLGRVALEASRQAHCFVLASYPAARRCAAKQMHARWVGFDHAQSVGPGDVLVCMGRDPDWPASVDWTAALEPLPVSQPEGPAGDDLQGGAGGNSDINDNDDDAKLLGLAPPSFRFMEAAPTASAAPQAPTPQAPAVPQDLEEQRVETGRQLEQDQEQDAERQHDAEQQQGAPLRTHLLLKSRSSLAHSRLDDARLERSVLGPLDALIPGHTARALHGHVIVNASGTAHSSLLAFVRHLRRASLAGPVPAVLILRPDPPRALEWSDLSAFPDVHWQLGRAYISQDLLRAGLASARALVLLSDPREPYCSEGHDSITADRDKLLSLRAASALRRRLGLRVHLQIHMACDANLGLACPTAAVVLQELPLPWSWRLPGRPLDLDLELRRDNNRIVKQLAEVWEPVWTPAFCEGSVWTPSALLMELWKVQAVGPWVEAFVEALIAQAGVLGGLNLVPVPAHLAGLEFQEVQDRLLRFGQGLAWGVFKRFDLGFTIDLEEDDGAGSKLHPSAQFRGVLLAPWPGLMVDMTDRLIVLNSAQE